MPYGTLYLILDRDHHFKYQLVKFLYYQQTCLHVMIKRTGFISSHCDYTAERPWGNGHCNNHAII